MSAPVAVVTGASRGIGAATARALAATHQVELIGRDAGALRAVAADCPGSSVHACDLTDPDAPAALARDLRRVDVLVHSAGTVRIVPLAETSVELWSETMHTNVIAVAELTRALLPVLRAAGGTVVLVNSGQGRTPTANWGAYAASKFALRAYGDVLRAEEPELRVTTVYPGRTATDMQRGVRAAEGGGYQPERYLRPESVASAVASAITAGPDAVFPEIVLRPR